MRRAGGPLLAAALALGAHAAWAQADAVPGEILVTLRGPADEAALRALEARTGGRVREVIPAIRLVRLSLPPSGGDAETALRAAGLPEVEDVEPNAIGAGGGFFPDDPQFTLQWHLHNTGQTSGTVDADIDAPEGWEVTRGGAEVAVAILDTGVDYAHPDFAGRLLPGRDTVNEDDDPSADHPHGVQVAGLFGANGDNAIQVAGVDHAAWILPVKVLDAANQGATDDLAEGLVWAADQGADVISMSLINYPTDSTALGNALQYARNAGATLVACAGNLGLGNAEVSGPGAYAETISAGWTDQTDARGQNPASGTESATGAALDVVAPGDLVITVSGSGGPFFGGCSAATPLVAGIASLLLAVDPGLTHDEVKQVLEASAVDLVGPPGEDTPGRDDFFGHGRANLAGALALVPEPASTPAAVAASLALVGVGRRGSRFHGA